MTAKSKSDQDEPKTTTLPQTAPRPAGLAEAANGAAVPAGEGGTGAEVPVRAPEIAGRRRLSLTAKLMLAGLIALIAGGGYFLWRQHAAAELPPGIVMTNGRLEAERVDVATKLGGRVEEVRVNEGDAVTKGEVLARMDTDSYEAQLDEAEANIRQAGQALNQARALVDQRQSDLTFATQELERSTKLAAKGYATQDTVDERQSVRNSAAAALVSAKAQVSLAEAQIDSAKAQERAAKVNIADSTILAPRDGRVQYRLALPGEVLAAGGRIVSLLDLTDVYMTVYLPTRDVGRLAMGSEAHIIFDAAPQYVVPATISYIASDAQFTPKYVETQTERDKLMYRVKLQLAPEMLKKYADMVKSGVTGVAYVKVAKDAVWPDYLQVKLP